MKGQMGSSRRSERIKGKIVLLAGYVLLVLAVMVLHSYNAVDDDGIVRFEYYAPHVLAMILIVCGNSMYAHSKGYSYSWGFLSAYTLIAPVIFMFIRERPESIVEAAATMTVKQLFGWAENSRAAGNFKEAEAAYVEIIKRVPRTSHAADAQRELDSLSSNESETGAQT